MRLGIISDAHHFYNDQGDLCVLTPVARQFEQWAFLFDKVIVCAPLVTGTIPKTHSPYRAKNIELLPVSPAGGRTLQAKLRLLQIIPNWYSAIQRLLTQVDAVHIRCPNNISIPGLLMLLRSSNYRQAVYTGTWPGYPGEPRTYRWQRWMLRKYFNGPVAVYGEWPDQPDHIVPSFSPSFSAADWAFERERVTQKITNLHQSVVLRQPLQLTSIGSLTASKNQQLVVRMVKALRELDIMAELHLLGDGEKRAELFELIVQLGLSEHVHLHGHTSHERVRQFLRESDFVVQATQIEGFGKVPIEAFFHGTVPILSDVNISKQLVGGTLRGRTFPQNDLKRAVQIIAELAVNPSEVASMIQEGRNFAQTMTMEAWRQHLQSMLETYWQISLSRADPQITL